MTSPTQPTFNTYIANGATTLFPFGFLLLEEDDLTVSVDGVGKVNEVDFTISGIGDVNGGNATFIKAPKNGSKVLLVRLLTLDRQTAYQDNGDLLAATLNRDFDRIWQVLQQLNYDSTRSLRMPIGSTSRQVEQANSLVAFDKDAKLGVINLSPLMDAFLRVSLASAARAVIGVDWFVNNALREHRQDSSPHPQYTSHPQARQIANESVEEHNQANDPHPQYTDKDEVKDIVWAWIGAHEGDKNPHRQYLTLEFGFGVMDAKIRDHKKDGNPHPQYTDDAEAREIADTQIALHKASRNPHPNVIGLFAYRVYFTESGIFTVPDDVTRVRVTVAGAGGGSSRTAVDVQPGGLATVPANVTPIVHPGGDGGQSEFKGVVGFGGKGGASIIGDGEPEGSDAQFDYHLNQKHAGATNSGSTIMHVQGGGVGARPLRTRIAPEVLDRIPEPWAMVSEYYGLPGGNGGLTIADLIVNAGETIFVVIGAGGASALIRRDASGQVVRSHPGSNGHIIVEY